MQECRNRDAVRLGRRRFPVRRRRRVHAHGAQGMVDEADFVLRGIGAQRLPAGRVVTGVGVLADQLLAPEQRPPRGMRGGAGGGVVGAQAQQQVAAKEKDGKEADPKSAKAPSPAKEPATPSKPADDTHKNGTGAPAQSADAAGDVPLEDDVQLQKAVELLKTWKIFKELRPVS